MVTAWHPFCDPFPQKRSHMKKKILIVEDNQELLKVLRLLLKNKSYEIYLALNGEQGVAMATTKRPDLIIMDILLPEMDGLQVCRLVRQESDMPIIMLTARVEEEDRLTGLDLGADDYLTKPFEMGEFDARVRALLRRRCADGLRALTCGALTLDIVARRASLNDRPLDLPRREFQLLEVLMSRRGRIISKDQIIDSISDFNDEMNPSTVELYIHRIRKKLEATDVTIRTVRGVGYTLE